MSREIKFRVWDSNTETMITEPAFINVGGDGTFQAFIENEPSGWLGKEEGVFLMQYTGLKDKNGKEIYEGDILKRSKETKPNFIAVIYFHRGSFNGVTHPGQHHSIPINNLSTCDYDGYGYDEVIGNIYETPELINNKTE